MIATRERARRFRSQEFAWPAAVVEALSSLVATPVSPALSSRDPAQQEADMPTIGSIDKLFSQATESKAMPGIVAVAATDKGTLYEGAFGKRELGRDAAMSVDSVVWIASMTKAIAGTAAMQLVERGK